MSDTGRKHAKSPMDWVVEHLGGLIIPFGERFEKVLGKSAFLLNGDLHLKIGKWYMLIATPIIVIEFVLRYI